MDWTQWAGCKQGEYQGNGSHCLIKSSIYADIMMGFLSICMWQPFLLKPVFF